MLSVALPYRNRPARSSHAVPGLPRSATSSSPSMSNPSMGSKGSICSISCSPLWPLEQLRLRLHDLDPRRTLYIVIRDAANPATHREAAHGLRVVGLQHLGRCRDIREPRIEPQIVAVGLEYHRHAIVDGCG